MTKYLLPSLLLIGSCSWFPVTAQQHTKPALNQNSAVPGFVNLNQLSTLLLQNPKDKTTILSDLNGFLNLPGDYTFDKIKETTDHLGITHISFKQYYRSMQVDNAVISLHFKDSKLIYINGYMLTGKPSVPNTSVSMETLKSKVKNKLGITTDLNVSKPQSSLVQIANDQYRSARSVRVNGKDVNGKLIFRDVWVDDISGEVIKEINLIQHADVPGTGKTMYNGPRNITVDSYNGAYRLWDNNRGIETYDAGGMTVGMSGYYVNPRNITHTTTNWDVFPLFSATTLQAANPNLISNIGSATGIVLLYTYGYGPASAGWQGLERLAERYVSNFAFPFAIPVTNRYFYGSLISAPPYTAWYLKYDQMQQQVVDSAFYSITNTTVGTHFWNDGNGNSGNYTIDTLPNPAVDVHWGLEETHDYFSSRFNRNGFDNNGGVIKSYMNAGYPNEARSIGAPYNFLEFGMGDELNMLPVVSLDIVGHEFTHRVVEYNGTGGLQYIAESGALNESFADIFGTCIEFAVKGQNANWTLGEGVLFNTIGPAYFRSMATPKTKYLPDTYMGTFWADITDLTMDNGGVHTNSSVQNKWFYLLTMGGSGTNDKQDQYNVPAIGIQKAEQIAYRNLTNYLTPAATFWDARQGALQSAIDLYGPGSPEYFATRKAWYAVGIGTDSTLVTDIENIIPVSKLVTLYPNPAHHKLTITSDLNQSVTAQIISASGVHTKEIQIEKGIHHYDVSDLAPGIYFLNFRDKRLKSQKLIIE